MDEVAARTLLRAECALRAEVVRSELRARTAENSAIVSGRVVDRASTPTVRLDPGSVDGHPARGLDDPDEREEPAIPARIGRYAVLWPLGQGGMGVVYAAFDDRLERMVAIKVLQQRRGGPIAHVRMLREAQALARLSHPNVVAVHDIDEADGQVYIAMEFVKGVTLRSWLKEQARSRAEVLDVFAQAGRGLAAAHAAGLVHRDFKPDNVMVGGDGRVRVMDFGLARASYGRADDGDTFESPAPGGLLDAPMTGAGSIVGTPGYMAPEQHRGAQADARSDIYGFCVALYEALYGARPMPADSGEETSGEHPQPPAPTSVPRWLREVVLRGLHGAPERRWQSIAELLAALARGPVAAHLRALRLTALVLAIVVVTAGLSFGAVYPRVIEVMPCIPSQLNTPMSRVRQPSMTATVTAANAWTMKAVGESQNHSSENIVERHGGRIWVESEVGRGSTFPVALPLHQSEERAPGTNP
jgi:serine/threonine protein kinase